MIPIRLLDHCYPQLAKAISTCRKLCCEFYVGMPKGNSGHQKKRLRQQWAAADNVACGLPACHQMPSWNTCSVQSITWSHSSFLLNVIPACQTRLLRLFLLYIYECVYARMCHVYSQCHWYAEISKVYQQHLYYLLPFIACTINFFLFTF